MTDTLALVAGQRRAAVDVLAALDPPQWDTPSLCPGWTVREVRISTARISTARIS
jgi:hypothetical protein